jgi:hypothetical protein
VAAFVVRSFRRSPNASTRPGIRARPKVCSAAQAVIFGMFGISVSPRGDVTIDPHPPRLSPSLALRGVRMRGRVFDVVVSGAEYEVRGGGKRKRARLGTPVTLQANRD